MNNFRSLPDDDEDDTLLFTSAEQYVLEHYPNPQRTGCPDPATLRAFVETPGDVALSDLNDVHILKCAECTRDLIELRRLRLERLQAAAPRSFWFPFRGWAAGTIAASVIVILVALFAVSWMDHKENDRRKTTAVAAITIDLSGSDPSKGADNSDASAIKLPRRLMDLHLVLPHGSPSGDYRVAVARQKSMATIQTSGTASAVMYGTHADLTVRLDLRQLSPGAYFLGVQQTGSEVLRFYPLTLD